MLKGEVPYDVVKEMLSGMFKDYQERGEEGGTHSKG